MLTDNQKMEMEKRGYIFAEDGPHFATKDIRWQFETLMEALDLYVERGKKNGQAWKRFGALNNLVRLATKAERLVQQFWIRQGWMESHPDLDDALDVINYAVFVLRQGREGKWFSDGES